MTIGMLLNAPYPDDVRIRKEASALQKAGFSVCLLCLRKKGELYQENVDGTSIERIDAGKNNFQLAFWDILLSLTFIHPKFKKVIPAWVAKNKIQAIHVHDLPLVGTALSLRNRLGIKVIADFHENYPEALRTWFAWKKNPIVRLKNKLFMNPEHWTKLEQRATLECDRIIAVVDEMKTRLITDYKVGGDRITVVSNTEDTSFLDQKKDEFIYQEFKGKFIIAYTGNIGPHRGVDTVIEAMALLKEHSQIIFVVVGPGSIAVMNMLGRLVTNLGLNHQVYFQGRQPFEKFYSYMHFANANIIPHKSNKHTDNTVPHKLFQSMMVGRPVIVSSCAPLKRIVNATQSGIIFEAGDPTSLANEIKRLYNNNELQKRLGENGIKATQEGVWNWEEDQKKLIKIYSSILKSE